jgi:peptide methionine sulfoxide reductase msrA/msrB
MDEEIRTIYLAGGCFWGIEHLLKALPGVVDTACGYANGTGAADANYVTVCTGTTGFRETVRVRYDPTKTSVDALLYALFQVIDVEARDRQGADVGTQYQAGVYWLPNDREAEADVQRICGMERLRHPGFAVETKPLQNYFLAEEYHQDYLDKNPEGYCHVPRAKIAELAALEFDPSYYRV